jgi:hypothetical protein
MSTKKMAKKAIRSRHIQTHMREKKSLSAIDFGLNISIESQFEKRKRSELWD